MSELFNMETVKQDSPRIQTIKKYDIQTHFSPGIDDPWLAVPMVLAREYTREQITSLPDMMACWCGLLDEAGFVFEGDTEESVIDDAIRACELFQKLRERLKEIDK